MVDNLLASVQRPGRYLGNEVNLPNKDWASCRVRLALAFPDVYEVGMSHLGLHLLYDILNQHEWIGAERVYALWVDMEAKLRAEGKPLVSLESGTPLAFFDVVGFSLQYELSYTNVINMLELGGISPLVETRKRDQPLVIGGGPCAFNPEPIAPFFDAVVLGDAEELILEIVETVDEWKIEGGGERLDLLKALGGIEGVYVPEFYRVRYNKQGRIVSITPRFSGKPKIRKRILGNLDDSLPSVRPLVPCIRIVHDRLNLEIMRGCTRGCRFCQAGTIYRPVRERSPQMVLQLVEEGLASSGHDELSLLALSIGDYSCICGLLETLMQYHCDEQVAVSLPSLRVGTLNESMIDSISRVRKTGFTLAPEAGSERLRKVINKGVSDSELLDTVKTVYSSGWRLIKLYFMMGLPTETDKDREALVELALKVWGEAANYTPRRTLHVSISTFVPKAHTPFQWESQLALKEMKNHLAFFKRHLRRKGLQLKWNEPWQSVLEGVFARGDRRLAPALLRAQQLGCRFDGWSEQLNPALWRQAFAETRIDPSFYNQRFRGQEEVHPWAHIDCGVTPDYLWKEYERALAEAVTPDCRVAGCSNCGVCDHKGIGLQLQKGKLENLVKIKRMGGQKDGRYRYRLMFAKVERARFVGHLETVTIFHRAMRRAALPLVYSQGHNPSPRISLDNALPLGIESRAEMMEVALRQAVTEAEIRRRVNAELPPGLEVLGVYQLPDKARKATPRLMTYEATLPEEAWPKEGDRHVQRQLEKPLRQRSKRGENLIHLDKKLLEFEVVSPDLIRFSFIQGGNGSIRVRDLLRHLFGLTEKQIQEARVMKVASQVIEGEHGVH